MCRFSVFCLFFFFSLYADHRDLHVLTHSFPTRRSSDLPWSLKAIAEASSPSSMQNFGPEATRCFNGRTRSPVASLTPRMRGSLDRAAMVSTDMSITQRGGIL